MWATGEDQVAEDTCPIGIGVLVSMDEIDCIIMEQCNCKGNKGEVSYDAWQGGGEAGRAVQHFIAHRLLLQSRGLPGTPGPVP